MGKWCTWCGGKAATFKPGSFTMVPCLECEGTGLASRQRDPVTDPVEAPLEEPADAAVIGTPKKG
jgi:hypothetical protein